MSPERVLQWLELQKEAGARVIVNVADQFLGRVVRKEGRTEVLEIMKSIRDLGFAIVWPNGLEFKKTTLGRGINRKEGMDFRPDEELIEALWGWDGKVGCHFAYLPAERPVFGRENYTKLLPWQEHCEVMKTIVRTGIPYVRYGVIIGFADDNDETLSRLEEAIWGLYEDLITINLIHHWAFKWLLFQFLQYREPRKQLMIQVFMAVSGHRVLIPTTLATEKLLIGKSVSHRLEGAAISRMVEIKVTTLARTL